MTVEKPREAPPDLHVAVSKVDRQVMSLENRIAEAEEEIRQLVALGRGNAAAKLRAVQAVKRKKMYEQQRDQLLGTQFNLETLTFQHDQAEITLTAVNAMKQGHMELKQRTADLDAGKVDELRADMEDLAEDMKAINEVLSGNADLHGEEEDALAAEYAKMEEELEAERVAASHRRMEQEAAAAAARAEAERRGRAGSRPPAAR
eukprot:CAMPEP_0179058682 /NCGR_PEP_ID=MMETSP0796-20121207/24973_1 /TAXON_ID=73915 /ORGANISM="Pyrodinium bahamense, Strain pbaha01" /LENGTH=203 /DNA_ID=CAMNT_0020755435 /DNA_START=119 /DNA_END=726 /DNA_ORIENTATION=-